MADNDQSSGDGKRIPGQLSLRGPVTRTFPNTKTDRPKDRADRNEMDHLQRLIDTSRQTAALDYIDDLIELYPTDIVLYLRASSICNGVGKDARRSDDPNAAQGHFEDAARYALSGLSKRAANVKLLCAAGNAYRELNNPDDDLVNRMITELEELGTTASEDGYAIEDAALDLIQNGDPDLAFDDDAPTPATPVTQPPGGKPGLGSS